MQGTPATAAQFTHPLIRALCGTPAAAVSTRYDHASMQTIAADPVTKIGTVADYVAAIYHEYAEATATQLIYCETVVVYAEIKRELIARGVAEAEIAFIQDYHTKTKKAMLFAALNQGTIRILLCSKQSTGMNIQQRLIALHHVDCPWRPGDLEQREGRIVRQGNVFPEVMIFAYATEHSFDTYKWQTVETKATFIEQMKRGDVTMREIDDIGDAVLSAAEMKAIASGNPLVMEKVKLDMTIQQLEAGEAADGGNRVKMRRRLVDERVSREHLCDRIVMLQAALAHAEQNAAQAKKTFTATVLDGVMSNQATAYTKRDAAGEAVLKIVGELTALAAAQKERQTRTIGTYRGFKLIATSYMLGGAEVTIHFPYAGMDRPIATAASVSLKTPSGVFQSVEYQINAISAAITNCAGATSDIDRATETITTFLETPWPQTDELRLVRERLERINAALTAAAEATPDEDQPIPLPAPAIPDPSAELVVVATSDAAHIAEPFVSPVWAMERPLVLLPTPSDRAAMAAAMRALSTKRDAEPVAITLVAVAPSTEPTLAPAELITHTPLPEVVSSATPTPTTRLNFGDLLQIQRGKASRRKPATPNRHKPATLPLFAAQPTQGVAAQQLSMF